MEEIQNWIEIIFSDHGYKADALEIPSKIHYFKDDVAKKKIILFHFYFCQKKGSMTRSNERMATVYLLVNYS